MKNRAYTNIETCTKRNLQKPTLLTEFVVRNDIKKKNRENKYNQTLKQVESQIRQKKIEKSPVLKSFLEEEEQKRKQKNNRIKKEMKRKGIDLEKIFSKRA